MPVPSRTAVATLALTVLSGGILVACGPSTTSGDAGQAGSRTVSSGTAQLGGPFTLTDDKGATVTEAAFEGTPTLLYFGFTYCPDVCPTALQKLGAAQERMGDYGDDVQYVLVSVDPERDTPEQLATYVSNNGFPEGLRGFTGTVEQILRGPAQLDDGTHNLLGALQTSMGTLGAKDLKEMQQVEVVIAPSLLTEGKVYQKAQQLGMGK